MADVISKSVRLSTLATYHKRWESYENWCDGCNLNTYVSSVPQILEYLYFLLRSDAKLTPGTIAGHKTAIIMTLTYALMWT